MKINKYRRSSYCSALTVPLLLLCLTACNGNGVPEINKLVTPGNDEKEPIVIPQPLFSALSVGKGHSLAIYGGVNETWNLYAWGYNGYGQLGDGTSRSKNSPVKIGTATNWKSIAAGAKHSLAINKAGELYAWGNNDDGQLGDGTFSNRNSPVKIGTATNWKSIAAGARHSLAINKASELYAWGWNHYGQLGDGTFSNRNSPVKIGTATNWKSIAAGDSHSLAISKAGELHAWGANFKGQLGNGTSYDRHIPTKIGTATNWKSIAGGAIHSLAINKAGELHAWGGNTKGQVGYGTPGTLAKQESPVKIGTATNWKSIAAGANHSLATNKAGELYAWGENTKGQLGLGHDMTSIQESPAKIGTVKNWKSIAVGAINNHSLAISKAGELYAWGEDTNGRLGDGGTNENKTIPVKIQSPRL